MLKSRPGKRERTPPRPAHSQQLSRDRTRSWFLWPACPGVLQSLNKETLLSTCYLLLSLSSAWFCLLHPTHPVQPPRPSLQPGLLGSAVFVLGKLCCQGPVCQTPHLCLLVFIRVCPIHPSSSKARKAGPALQLHGPPSGGH